MKLYEVTNGFTGFSYVRCLVVAASKKDAIQLSREKFKEQPEAKLYERYYKNLKAELIFNDLSKCQVGEVCD